ncbi:hypothetical protein LY78DRAFT_588606 [Colletotrichum sublineola]|nr:hypothetical protein LY78DRAFT_588606 [Colletotrichum sublineola]
MCRINVYLRLPNWITIDASLNFYAAKFKRPAWDLSTDEKEVPIEAHHCIDKGKCCYAALRCVYVLRVHSIAFRLAVKAINNTASLDGLMPIFIVFSAYLHIIDNWPPSATALQREKRPSNSTR